MDLALTSRKFHSAFDVNAEMNFPTWFSTVLLFSIALFAFALQTITNPSRYKVFTYFWGIFSAMYFYFSMDETVRFHELSTFLFNSKSFHWYYLYFPFAFALFVYCFLYFKLGAPSEIETRNWILLGMLVLAFGGIGFEAVYDLLINSDTSEYLLRLCVLLEEGMEMAGAAMILQGCWLKLSDSISVKKY